MNSEKSDERQPEYTLVASGETAHVGIIRNTRTGEYYQSFGDNPSNLIPTDYMRALSLIGHAMLIQYRPSISLKDPSEWAEKARQDKRRLDWSPTVGPNSSDAKARKDYSKHTA